MSTRPTPDQVAEALTIIGDPQLLNLSEIQIEAIATICAATKPPTDDEIVAAYELQPHTHGLAVIQTVRHFFGPVKP